jgi:hypothetical protein
MDLESEIGDIFFNAFMVVHRAQKEFGINPKRAYARAAKKLQERVRGRLRLLIITVSSILTVRVCIIKYVSSTGVIWID